MNIFIFFGLKMRKWQGMASNGEGIFRKRALEMCRKCRGMARNVTECQEMAKNVKQ